MQRMIVDLVWTYHMQLNGIVAGLQQHVPVQPGMVILAIAAMCRNEETSPAGELEMH